MKDLWFIFFSIGIAQGLFLITAIWVTKKKRQFSKELLTLILFCSITLLVSELIKISGDRNLIIKTLRVGETIPLLIGPLFYLYTLSAVNLEYRFQKQDFLHFVPFLFFTLLFLPFYLESNQFKIEYINNLHFEGRTASITLFIWLKGLYILVYLILSWVLAHRSRKKKLNRSLNVNMVYWLVIFQFFGVFATQLVVTSELFDTTVGISSDRIGAIYITSTYYIFTLILIIAPNTILPENLDWTKKNKYKKSSLSDTQKAFILDKLKYQLEDERPFLQSDLTLNDLANSIDLNPNLLSQVINEMLDKNFYRLISEYRVAEFKKNVADPQKTIYGAALDSGFNSKSAFNRVFKEITGITPSQYRKKLEK